MIWLFDLISSFSWFETWFEIVILKWLVNTLHVCFKSPFWSNRSQKAGEFLDFPPRRLGETTMSHCVFGTEFTMSHGGDTSPKYEANLSPIPTKFQVISSSSSERETLDFFQFQGQTWKKMHSIKYFTKTAFSLHLFIYIFVIYGLHRRKKNLEL